MKMGKLFTRAKNAYFGECLIALPDLCFGSSNPASLRRRNMNKREAALWASGSWEKSRTVHGGNVFQVGSRVRVTSYSPFRGLKGTIRIVDTITADLEEPFCFYLIALDGTYMKEPMWFEYNEVEGIDLPAASLHESGYLSYVSE